MPESEQSLAERFARDWRESELSTDSCRIFVRVGGSWADWPDDALDRAMELERTTRN